MTFACPERKDIERKREREEEGEAKDFLSNSTIASCYMIVSSQQKKKVF